jgi:hypothetical protein
MTPKEKEIKKDWKERRQMTDFLYQKGWQLTKNELLDIIQEYNLEEKWKNKSLEEKK